jgi:gamma-glutamyltranspeptidase/glutathione hydrolase
MRVSHPFLLLAARKKTVNWWLCTDAALAAPRLHDQLQPNLTTFEIGYDEDVVEDMAARGHNVTWVAAVPGLASAQGILRTLNGTLQAVGEPRQYASGGSVWVA